MKYIDAEILKSKIDKIIEVLTKSCDPDPLGWEDECMADAEIETLELVKNIIDDMMR